LKGFKIIFLNFVINYMAEKEIGKVIHYYDKAMVAVVKLSGKIALGDMIKVVRGDNEFEMKVESMQVEHKSVKSGKKGEEVAIKVSNPTKQGARIYKVAG